MERLTTHMGSTAVPTNPSSGADLTLLQTALARCRVLKFTYKGWQQSEARERLVEPLALVHYLERWHLIAWCRDRKAMRDFRADRMNRVSLLPESFEPREDFSLSAYLNSMPQPELRAEIRFTTCAADRARREWWLGILSEKATTSGTVLTLATVGWERLAGWLLSFGEEADVLAPGELRKQLVKAAWRVAKHHGKIVQAS